MTVTSISICTDSEITAKAQAILDDLGLDMSTAFNIFLKQMVDQKMLPFEIDKSTTTNRKLPRSELRGCLKGKVWMAGDFDAPLEEMREYME